MAKYKLLDRAFINNRLCAEGGMAAVSGRYGPWTSHDSHVPHCPEAI